jgi:hypothetical protein
MIDVEKLDAEKIAELIGRSVSEVRSFYRNFSIVEQAEEEFGIPDSKRIVDEFGVWTRAMSNPGIRGYIGAPAPREVVEREYPLDGDAEENLARLTVWLFGHPRSDDDMAEGKRSREGRAISDSRQLTRFGAVLAHPKGRDALVADQPLEVAELATIDDRDVFMTALDDARSSLEFAVKHRPKRITKGPQEVLSKLSRLLKSLREDDGDRTD